MRFNRAISGRSVDRNGHNIVQLLDFFDLTARDEEDTFFAVELASRVTMAAKPLTSLAVVN